MQNLCLFSIWKAKRKQNSHINYHTHKYNELVFYTSGKGVTEIGGKTFNFSANHFAVIPSSTEHNETHYTDSNVICLEFSGNDNLPIGFYTDTDHAVHRILNDILNEVKEQPCNYKKMLTIKLNELLLQIIRNQNDNVSTKSFTYIINYLRENFHEHINLSDCASQLNISYDYFQHKFKAQTGYSPQQFLIEQRLNASQKILLTTDYSCTEIAYRCGFCTSAQFSAMFKRKYGLSPFQYKKRNIQKA